MDSSCNPYLASTALLAAGLDGIERELDPGAINRDNMYRIEGEDLKKRGIGMLPSTLKEAIEEFERDEVIREALGSRFSDFYAKMKKQEWTEYHNTVSQWELDRYLNYL